MDDCVALIKLRHRSINVVAILAPIQQTRSILYLVKRPEILISSISYKLFLSWFSCRGWGGAGQGLHPCLYPSSSLIKLWGWTSHLQLSSLCKRDWWHEVALGSKPLTTVLITHYNLQLTCNMHLTLLQILVEILQQNLPPPGLWYVSCAKKEWCTGLNFPDCNIRWSPVESKFVSAILFRFEVMRTNSWESERDWWIVSASRWCKPILEKVKVIDGPFLLWGDENQVLRKWKWLMDLFCFEVIRTNSWESKVIDGPFRLQGDEI